MNFYKRIRLRYKNYTLQQKLKKASVVFHFNAVKYKTKNVFIIDSIIPEHNKDSGSRRLFNIIKILLKNDYGVFLMADKKEYKYKTDYVAFYENLGVTVYKPSVTKDGEFITKEDFIAQIAPNIQFAWLHRPDVFYAYYKTFIQLSNARLIYDMVDFHFLRMRRELLQNPSEKLKKETEKYLLRELECSEKADKIITISNDDKTELLKHYSDASKMITVSNIHQHKNETVNSWSARQDLLFVGGFSHAPNIDAVKYLHDTIMPLVWKENKHIKVKVVGSYPTQEILNLNTDNFQIIGFVNNLDTYFNKSRVFVAPLRYGAGVKGKIGQSLEFSLPLITTSVGAEGFDFGKVKQYMVGETPQELANKILELYSNENLWYEVSNQAQYILEPFSLKQTETNILKVLA